MSLSRDIGEPDMREIYSTRLKKIIKNYQIKFWLMGSIFLITSQIIPYLEISYAPEISLALIAIGISTFWASIFPILAFPYYNGEYSFVMGTFVGLLVVLVPALILRDLNLGNLWMWMIILGWISGGYLSIRDQEKTDDDVLNSPLANFLAIGGIFVGFIFGMVILSLIIPLVLAIFSISIPYLYSVIISAIITNIFLVRYLSKKVFSVDLDDIEYKPNVQGVFGSFIGGVGALILSFLIKEFYIQNISVSMPFQWIGVYSGLVAGIAVGFFLGYQIEKFQSQN